eukprot:SAG11_NODE_2133_length_3774_cov_6.924898_4_plen_111_part_00
MASDDSLVRIAGAVTKCRSTALYAMGYTRVGRQVDCLHAQEQVRRAGGSNGGWRSGGRGVAAGPGGLTRRRPEPQGRRSVEGRDGARTRGSTGWSARARVCSSIILRNIR